MLHPPPSPGERHPFYLRHMTGEQDAWLRTWLSGPGTPHRAEFALITAVPTARLHGMLHRLALDKHRAVALAPSVGRQRWCVWYYAVDRHGRWIAGEQVDVHMSDRPW